MAASGAAHPSVAAILIAVGLTASWVATYSAGGTATAMPHVFYVPVVLAGARFRHAGALVVALAAGLLCGPLMPLNVESNTDQSAEGWLLRLVFFFLIGQVVAALFGRTFGTIVQGLARHRAKVELENALSENQFFVVYQPLFDLHDGRLVSVEALVRWQHPHRGLVPPNDFIPDAESTGVITDIGNFVLREATTQLAAWRKSHRADPRLKVAVNVSTKQLLDPDFAVVVKDLLNETGLEPENLQLEVTESALIANIADAAARVDVLRELGVEIAIDDFGTGQSSLAYLHWFHPHVVKIDRIFVNALGRRDRSTAVAEGVVRLAASVGARTVAEGIETESQADTMRALGCDVGQGFFFARPASSGEIERLLPMTRSGKARAQQTRTVTRL